MSRTHAHSAGRALRRLVPLGLVAALLVACGDDAGDELAEGQTREVPVEVEGTVHDVRVPSGAVEVTVGDPVSEVGAGADAVRAPDGASLVPVSWSLDRFQTAGVTGFDAETTLSLAVGDRTVEVVSIPDDAASATGSAIVSVPGEEAPATLLADYDGVEQRFGADGSRESGVAEPLYAPEAEGVTTDCSDDWTLETGTPRVDCEVDTFVLPYLPGVGWAEEGSVHAVVEPRIVVTAVEAGGARYRPTYVSSTTEVDGVAPTSGLEPGSEGPGSVAGRLVVPAEGGPSEWTSELVVTLRASTDGPLDGESVTLRGSTDLSG